MTGVRASLPARAPDMTDYNFKPKTSPDEFGWYGLRFLPHFDGEGVTQFVTFRLYDSLPQELLNKWRSAEDDDLLFRKRVEGYLDSGNGQCFLREPEVASILKEALLFNHEKTYDLHAWVIMPNHAHILTTPYKGVHLPTILHSIKSFSAQKANKLLGRKGTFWQRGSFDRYIRDQRHFAAVVRYIENNPVKAGLCERPEDWQFSSAYKDS